MRYMVCRYRVMSGRLLARQLLLQQRKEHGVLPFAVLQVRPSLRALAHVAAGLGMCERTLVEAVDLQLDAVEVEVDEQVALECACALDADPAAAEVGMDGEATRLCDAVALIDAVERDTAG